MRGSWRQFPIASKSFLVVGILFGLGNAAARVGGLDPRSARDVLAERIRAVEQSTVVFSMEFEWDEAKRQGSLAKHGVDFLDATALFNGRPVVTVVG